jgi:uncharacterized RDD family membrane protein YckC
MDAGALAHMDTVEVPSRSRPRRTIEHADLPVKSGDTLDHFTIDRELGRGGMGVVFLARDTSLDRDVAIKVIVPKRGDGTSMERFFREARAQAKLASPHVVRVFFIGRVGHGAYFAMEHIEGESLEAMLDRGERLEPEAARLLMLDVARGLAEAHAAGFIHRDIKPSNLLIDKNGQIKIADFGLAKPLTDQGSLTGDGVVLGTPMYMAPEQVKGTDLDHRADMYALGASFFNLLAGEPPYAGDAVTMMAKHLQDPVPALRAKTPHVPVPLATIVERLMQKDREKRFGSYAELVAALEAAAPGAVEPAGFALRAAAAMIDLGIGSAAVAFLGPLGAAAYLAALIAAQAFTGQTAGKWLFRIRAERTDGARLGTARAAARVAAAAWLPLLVAGVVLATRGTDDLFAIASRAAQIDQMRGLLTAFAVGNAALSLLYGACLAFAAIHPGKRAVHDLLVGSRVVHVRQVTAPADPSRKSRISI